MSDQDRIVGHKTMPDGTHAPLTASEADALWQAVEAQRDKQALEMPEAIDALRVILGAMARLRALGWSDAMYCPKDGSEFAVVQFGCTGIFTSIYLGEWPHGSLEFADSSHAPSGHLWKRLDWLTTAEREKLAETEEAHRAFSLREMEAFVALPQEDE